MCLASHATRARDFVGFINVRDGYFIFHDVPYFKMFIARIPERPFVQDVAEYDISPLAASAISVLYDVATIFIDE